MDQHPVPQDITGFQFKLVGDMTLKQFGYLAAGAILAFFFYNLPWHPLVKLPVAFILGMTGVALAFIPINERPLETWIVNFFFSIYRPTQYVWKKSPQKLDFFDFAANDATPVAVQEPTPRQSPTEKLNIYLDTINSINNTSTTPAQNQTSEEPKKIDVPAETVQTFDVDALLQTRQQATGFSTPPQPKEPETPKVEEKPFTVDDLMSARQPMPVPEQPAPPPPTVEEQNKKLLDQISQIKGQLQGLSQPSQTPTKDDVDNNILKNEVDRLKKELRLAKQGVTPADPNARVRFSDKIPIQTTTDGKMPPNTVYGLVDDSHGIPLPNVVVLIKDTTGTPVRALRTNKLGQFIATTPLANGTYYIELEREGLSFDIVELNLSGQPLEPLEIKAK